MFLRHCWIISSCVLASTFAYANSSHPQTIQSGSYISTEDHSNSDSIASIYFNNDSLAPYPSSRGFTQASTGWFTHHPVRGVRINSHFGMRKVNGKHRHHAGVDFAAPTGTPIYAVGSGIVTKAGWGNGWGNYVEINHGNGYVTRYAHASRLHVRVGDQVQAGRHIANIGNTGRSTGAHLHFEVVQGGRAKNPVTYLAMLP